LIKKLTSKKGVSPILAALLLVAIAVAAAVITYAWITTFVTAQTRQSGAVLGIENIRFYNVTTTKYVEVIIRNWGTADAEIATVYMGTTSTNLTPQTSVAYDPATKKVSADSLINITITYTWQSGTRYYFKVATDAGEQLPFSEEAP